MMLKDCFTGNKCCLENNHDVGAKCYMSFAACCKADLMPTEMRLLAACCLGDAMRRVCWKGKSTAADALNCSMLATVMND